MEKFYAAMLVPFYLLLVCGLIAWPIRKRVKRMKDGWLKRVLLMRIGDPSPFDPDREEIMKQRYFRP